MNGTSPQGVSLGMFASMRRNVNCISTMCQHMAPFHQNLNKLLERCMSENFKTLSEMKVYRADSFVYTKINESCYGVCKSSSSVGTELYVNTRNLTTRFNALKTGS